MRDLLATPDAIRITTPALSRETMERVLEIIRKDVTQDQVRVDTPTQNLESYFLEVVHKARQAAAETSGAMSGARVAAYLRDGAETHAPADKILERLAAPQPAPPAPAPVVEPTAPAVDQKKLAALAQRAELAAPARKPEPEPQKAAELEQANEKLAGLVSKQK